MWMIPGELITFKKVSNSLQPFYHGSKMLIVKKTMDGVKVKVEGAGESLLD